MTDSKFEFYELSKEACVQMQLAPIPFPVRSRRAKSVFGKAPLKLDKILEELDYYLKTNPEQSYAYAHNAAKLGMICATNHIQDGDEEAALKCLETGLRADPENGTLMVHRALVLQMLGNNELAAEIYEAVLSAEPHTSDPVIYALAAKAYAAAGQKEEGSRLLEGLATESFQDDDLQELRISLMQDENRDLPNTEDLRDKDIESKEAAAESQAPENTAEFLICKNCSAGNDPNSNFCKNCGDKLSKTKIRNFCSQCGAKLSPSKKFCTECGTARES